MFIVAGIVILLFFTLTGLLIWTLSDLPLAIREIAINTREERVRGSAYNLLKGLNVVLKIFACLTWLTGAILSYALATPLGAMLETLLNS